MDRMKIKKIPPLAFFVFSIFRAFVIKTERTIHSKRAVGCAAHPTAEARHKPPRSSPRIVMHASRVHCVGAREHSLRKNAET